MLAGLARLLLRATLLGLVLGAITAALGLGAIAVSELLSRRSGDRLEDESLADAPESTAAAQALDEEFLALLACPVCKTHVRREADWLVCDSCGRRYPIRDGIPVMLVEEAVLPGGTPGEAPA
jgi:uncharacterized protein YbaR (Trm112 family)